MGNEGYTYPPPPAQRRAGSGRARDLGPTAASGGVIERPAKPGQVYAAALVPYPPVPVSCGFLILPGLRPQSALIEDTVGGSRVVRQGCHLRQKRKVLPESS